MNLLINDIINSRKTKIPFVSRKAFNNVPTWSFFINYLNFAIKFPEMTRKIGDYYFVLQVFDEHLDSVKNSFDHLYKFLSENHPLGLQVRPAFLLSFLDTIPNLPKHSDSCDQMHIACVGTSKWTLYLNGSETIYILNPGDLMFIPTGVEHIVESVTPRAGITYSANYEPA